MKFFFERSNDMKITKAVIPCGGMGTRFLPITKAVPKEILPVIDTPVLAHIVNEAVNSGITDIMIVTYSLCIQDLKHCLMKYLNLWWNQVIFSIWLE